MKAGEKGFVDEPLWNAFPWLLNRVVGKEFSHPDQPCFQFGPIVWMSRASRQKFIFTSPRIVAD